MKPLHIGIDFDNTIVSYDGVFYEIALRQGLIPKDIPPSKTAIRNFFRSMGREEEWTLLQGYVYGTQMDLAKPFSGIDAFFSHAFKENCKISIISHKTKIPYKGPSYDLHAAAKKWLYKQPFFHLKIDVYFELTLEEKLSRIQNTGCDLFIDDLPEIFREPAFPSSVKKILFDPDKLYPLNSLWNTLFCWKELPLLLEQLKTSCCKQE